MLPLVILKGQNSDNCSEVLVTFWLNFGFTVASQQNRGLFPSGHLFYFIDRNIVGLFVCTGK